MHVVGVAFAPLLQGSHVGLGNQRAGGAGVRQDYFGLRVQDLGGFCHETDTGKHDDVSLGLAGKQRQLQAIADLVGHLLDFRLGVVVGEGYNAFAHDVGTPWRDGPFPDVGHRLMRHNMGAPRNRED